jgi:hypothetical protein
MAKLTDLVVDYLDRNHRKPLTPAAQAKLDVGHVLYAISQNPDDFIAKGPEGEVMRQALNRLRVWAKCDGCPKF